MASPKATSHDEQQKDKTPMGSPTEMAPPSILSRSVQSPSDAHHSSLAGQKRQRSPSSEGNPQNQYSLPAESPHDLKALEPPQPEDNKRCSNCGFPCWRCMSFKGPPDLAELHENQVLSMEPPSTPEAASTTNPTKTKRKICEANGKRFVGPRDDDFEYYILMPCGMYPAEHEQSTLTPTTIFGTQSSASSSRVFINKTSEELKDIMEDYNDFKSQKGDEHALSMICADSIVLRDRKKFKDLFDETEVIRAERIDRWRPCKEGPDPRGDNVYDWDLVPDVTYTVSLGMFNAKDRIDLKSKSCERWLANGNSVCPYLTIEYKSSEQTGKMSHARNQTAAASLLWLHQRKQIREALSNPLDDLRHYSIIIFDVYYVISETRFRGVNYHVRTLASGELTKIDDLNIYIEWSNAIHTWGLGPNATSFKKDIKAILQRQRAPTPPPLRDHVQTDT